MSPSIAFAADGARHTLGVDDPDVGDRAGRVRSAARPGEGPHTGALREHERGGVAGHGIGVSTVGVSPR
ncbi:hypothetical protein ABZV80_25035 [Streptomyces sp. NPDC005132]|uniref:hypothetical protein n=1 Tax=Streptomyces sp. NPDC005132 TaxID=3154294 RepID=UPI0033AAC35D